MTRTYLVTGAASGIGRAAATLLKSRANRVIGVDLSGADVTADLSTPDGRNVLIEQAHGCSDGKLDGVVLCAGTAAPIAAAPSINFFGTLAALHGLRPLLARSELPRVAVVTSLAATFPVDTAIVEACLAFDEAEARRMAQLREGDTVIYTSTKKALALACRSLAVTKDWAGAGILVNMVAPGIVDTPMIERLLRDPSQFAALTTTMPLPTGRYGRAEEIAEILAFLVSKANTMMVGQHLYIDNGSDAIRRPEWL